MLRTPNIFNFDVGTNKSMNFFVHIFPHLSKKKKRLVRKPNTTSLCVGVPYSKILSSHLLPGLTISGLYRVLTRSRWIPNSSELITFVATLQHSLWYRRHEIIIYVM